MGSVNSENKVEVTTTLVAKAVSLWYLAASTAVVTAAGMAAKITEIPLNMPSIPKSVQPA